MEYLPRVVDSILASRLKYKGAVVIEGPKWCGKTWTARKKSESELDLADTQILDEAKKIIQLNGKLLLEGDTPRLIDEWQEIPRIWDLIRNEVDKRGAFGQFILTGSAVTDKEKKEEIHHSGTGRFSRITMRTMSLWESKDSTGEISLADLFQNKEEQQGRNQKSLEEICFLIARGGWPMSVFLPEEGALFQAIDYYEAVIHYDVSRVDGHRRSPIFANQLMRVYARHVGYSSPITTIRDDMADGDKKPDVDTINSYLTAFKEIFMIEEMPAWNPNIRSKTAIRTSNTRYFTDPSIGCAALGIGPQDLLRDLKMLGMMFENLCIRDLRIYSQKLEGQMYHYRDSAGLECDTVIHLRNGQYALVEIKLGGETQIEQACLTLKKLESKIDKEKMGNPAFSMVITAVGNYAYKRMDGIWIVPIGTLKD